MKTRISAPAHPSATGGRVSGLVLEKTNQTTTIQWTGRWKTEALLLGWVQDLVETKRFHTEEDAER